MNWREGDKDEDLQRALCWEINRFYLQHPTHKFAAATSQPAHNMLSYLHDDEDDQRDEDVELRVFPGLGVTNVVKLLGDALFGPGSIIQKSHQRLLLGELQEAGSNVTLVTILVLYNNSLIY